jgi:hypothetical protein
MINLKRQYLSLIYGLICLIFLNDQLTLRQNSIVILLENELTGLNSHNLNIFFDAFNLIIFLPYIIFPSENYILLNFLILIFLNLLLLRNYDLSERINYRFVNFSFLSTNIILCFLILNNSFLFPLAVLILIFLILNNYAINEINTTFQIFVILSFPFLLLLYSGSIQKFIKDIGKTLLFLVLVFTFSGLSFFFATFRFSQIEILSYLIFLFISLFVRFGIMPRISGKFNSLFYIIVSFILTLIEPDLFLLFLFTFPFISQKNLIQPRSG